MSEQVEHYIQFEINNYDDRQNLIRAFVNAGYKVWCTTTQQLLEVRYFVNVVKP